MSKYIFSAFIILNGITFSLVSGHGMMVDPPSRASRWRFDFKGPKEYTDNQLSCGGRTVQWFKHKGKCGVCGDEYGIANPKFEYPGKFARDAPIVRVYYEGQKIDVTVRITASHKGYFTFRVAPLVNPPITQRELDEIMLELANGDAEWQLPSGNRDFKISLQLPTGLTCEHCVLQWWYTTGNNYINDKPETFVNCADIEIRPRTGPRPSRPRPSSKPKPKPEPSQRPVTKTTRPTERPYPGGKKCKSKNQSSDMDDWCRRNCLAGYCPLTHCICE